MRVMAGARAFVPSRVGRPQLFVLGDDLGHLAALAVAFRMSLDVSLAAITDRLTLLPATPPDAVVVDLREIRPRHLPMLTLLRRRFPLASMLLLAEDDPIGLVCDCAAVNVEVLRRRPIPINGVRDRLDVRSVWTFPADAMSRAYRPAVLASIEYLSQNYQQAVRVSAVAAASGISVRHLTELFRQETGATLKQYVTQIRVEVVKWMLSATDERLDAIAEFAGFADASHLSRVFARYVGSSPGEYRRRFQR
jgi:AraC-like DNA-binding protein